MLSEHSQAPHFSFIPTGIDEIDKEHKLLVDLLNDLTKLLFASKDHDNKIISLFNEVIKETINHFVTEETLIKRYSSEKEAKQHSERHTEIVSTLLGLKTKYELNIVRYQINYLAQIKTIMDDLLNHDKHLVKQIKIANLGEDHGK